MQCSAQVLSYSAATMIRHSLFGIVRNEESFFLQAWMEDDVWSGRSHEICHRYYYYLKKVTNIFILTKLEFTRGNQFKSGVLRFARQLVGPEGRI